MSYPLRAVATNTWCDAWCMILTRTDSVFRCRYTAAITLLPLLLPLYYCTTTAVLPGCTADSRCEYALGACILISLQLLTTCHLTAVFDVLCTLAQVPASGIIILLYPVTAVLILLVRS